MVDFSTRMCYNEEKFPVRGCTVVDVKPIIAKNITALRQNHKMTQIELAEKLNYSDKAVSKWERGESVPDIGVLKAIADMFGVTVDYLLQEEHAEQNPEERVPVVSKRAPVVITLLSVLLVWMMATLAFVIITMVNPYLQMRWMPFMCAMPVTGVVWLVFNSIWFNQRRNYLIISLLMWACIGMLVIMLFINDIFVWQWLILAVLGQAGIIMWAHFRPSK